MNVAVFTRKSATGLTIGLLLNLIGSIASAQSPADLETSLNSANELLRELDDKALNCMGSFSMNLGEAAALLCDEFLRAVDGELLARYIANCKMLKNWRDEETAKTRLASSETEAADSLLVNIESSCGKNAVEQNTQYVFTAFNTLKQGTLLNQTTGQSLERRLAEIEFQTRLNSQGRSLQEAILQQGQQSIQSNQQQIRQLENELIRQRINNRP